jgi:peptidoglycan hydrolase-like protein with peptidoglycan-binding domain
MLKLKSKAILAFAGLMVAAFVLVGSVKTASADMITLPSTGVKATSSMSSIQSLQTFLNWTLGSQITPLVVDGVYGAKTTAAIKLYQSQNGLVADGKFGPLSAAKAMALQANGGVTLPSTGALCPNGMTLASNCMTPPGGAPTVTLCPNGMTLASNCMTSPTGGVTTGGLMGGAGSATITELSSPSSSTKVGEGDINTKVYGVEIEADNGSDLAVTSMKLTFTHSGSGSSKLDRYAKSVSIWYNDVKIGSANLSEFSEDSSTYTKSITLANAIVKAGATGKFYVAVDAISDIDSGNVGSSNNTWTVTLSSTRYQDATGAVLTDSTGSLANTFIFDSLANTSDVELKVQLSSGTPTATTVKVSTTSDTNQVKLLDFTLKAQGSNMVVDQIPVLFTGSETDLDQVTSNVTLVIDGKTFNETVSTSAAATATISFDDLGLNMSAGSTLSGSIYADINDIESSTFDEGTTLDAAITSTLVTTTGTSAGALDVEDSNGDQVASGDRTGSAQGYTMTFRSTGVNVVMGTPSYNQTENTSGDFTQVTYTIPVAVTSFGNTLYMGQTVQYAATASASNAFAFVFQNSSAPTTSDLIASASATLSTSDASIDTNGYRLDDGTTKHFTLEITLTTPTTAANSYRVALKQLQTFTNAALYTGASAQSLTPAENYQTAYKLITS